MWLDRNIGLCLFQLLVITGVSVWPVLALAAMSGSVYQVTFDTVAISAGAASGDTYQVADVLGGVAVGESSGSIFQTTAGPASLQGSYLSVSGPDAVLMDTPLGGLSGGESNGAITLTAATDNPAGYVLLIQATGSPAMVSDSVAIDNFASTTEYDFMIAADESAFGFSVSGSDVVDQFRSTALACGGGVSVPNTCWQGLTTTPTMVAERRSATDQVGVNTTIHYRVAIGPETVQLPGEYVATTIITILPN